MKESMQNKLNMLQVRLDELNNELSIRRIKLSLEKDFENKPSNILPFQKKKFEKFKSSAMLVAIDLQSGSEGISEDSLTKLIEEKLDASVLHVEYLDVEFPEQQDAIQTNSVNDNKPIPFKDN